MAGFNPFKSKPPVQKPNRNAFDLSHANNLTMEFGKLYPVLCQEVIPGDTFDIDTTFGLRFMPMVFPVQTRMRADLHFFYVRNRNLWSDWKEFQGKTKDLSSNSKKLPWLQISPMQALERLKTGSLLDYLGVPTTVVGNVSPSWRSGLTSAQPIKELSTLRPVSNIDLSVDFSTDGLLGWKKVILSTYTDWYVRRNFYGSDGKLRNYAARSYNGVDMKLSQWNTLNPGGNTPRTSAFTMTVNPLPYVVSEDSILQLDSYGSLSALGASFKASVHIFTKNEDGEFVCQASTAADDVTFTIGSHKITSPEFGKILVYPQASYCSYQVSTTPKFTVPDKMALNEYCNLWLNEGKEIYIAISSSAVSDVLNKVQWRFGADYPFVGGLAVTNLVNDDILDGETLNNPFVSYTANGPAQPLSALPCRAYEAIYNSFYRNIQVSPFKINGEIEYNKFIPTDAGGPDKTEYKLHYRDWEDDFLTTALPSPQQGLAPLVGAIQNRDTQGTLTYFDSTGAEKQMKIMANKSGDVTAISVRDGDLPESTIKSLNEAVNFGISINDFRNVNALQRWLEKNMRRGFRYKDQILSHFGVNISYEACDMPEYIGGISQDVNVSTINQTSPSDVGQGSVLGEQGGQGTCLGSSRHKVNKYFDESGFVIGILSVSPIPSYSQLLPKMFTKFDVLDFYTPEFNHIGMQPISYREVCPIQQFSGGGNLDDTFGYQRAWYDYLASVDEVHGEFRKNLRNYLVNRVFGVSPQLGEEFLRIDPNQVNNIFNYTKTSDKIIGQLYFQITAVRPISKFGEPRLE